MACASCGASLQVGDWPFCPHGPANHKNTALPWHPSETSVVFEHPVTGDVKYPGKSDIPMPERYAKYGYVRKEIRTDRDMQKFEVAHGVRNERAWFDKGSGKSFDNDGRL